MKTTTKEYIIAAGLTVVISLPWALPALMAVYCEAECLTYLAWAGKNVTALIIGGLCLELVRGKGPTLEEISYRVGRSVFLRALPFFQADPKVQRSWDQLRVQRLRQLKALINQQD